MCKYEMENPLWKTLSIYEDVELKMYTRACVVLGFNVVVVVSSCFLRVDTGWALHLSPIQHPPLKLNSRFPNI